MKLFITSAILLSVVYVTRPESVVDATEDGVECALLSSSCEDCVKSPKCLWCSSSTVTCIPYPVKQIIPPKDVCDLGDARWGVCWVNYKILLITMAVIAGVLILSVISCICCCCYRCKAKSARARVQLEEERFERERQERNLNHAERRGERQTRMEEIRRKYGLVKDSEPVYQRFENET